MKKAMWAMLALVFAVTANGSTVTWGAGSASVVDSTKITAGTMYLVYASGTVDFTAFSNKSSFSTATLESAGFTKTIDSFAYSATTFQKKNAGITPTATGLAYGSYSLYTVLISEDGDYAAYATTPQSVTIAGTAGQNQTRTTAAFTYAAAVQSVPEPVSGVLSLIGIGMLALRRKKA